MQNHSNILIIYTTNKLEPNQKIKYLTIDIDIHTYIYSLLRAKKTYRVMGILT